MYVKKQEGNSELWERVKKKSRTDDHEGILGNPHQQRTRSQRLCFFIAFGGVEGQILSGPPCSRSEQAEEGSERTVFTTPPPL